HLWWKAREAVNPILEGLRGLLQVERAEVAGSFRRHMETVGDLDFIVASTDPVPVMDWFVGQAGVEEISTKGETKSSIRLAGGMQADLRVVPPEQFFFALHHFTGSKDHNVEMRQRALSMGLSLSEWGLKQIDEGVSSAPPPASIGAEEEIFTALDLAYIPPELREGNGEIEIAECGTLPVLPEVCDLRGVFHNHTTASDGRDTLVDMAAAAAARGWEYLGIADHSKASFQANGLDEKRVLAQIEDIATLNRSGKVGVHLFAGIEVDILGDGSLDLPTTVLAELDYVVASVHSRFSQSEEEMTARLVRAIEHPFVTMVGHLSGRLLLRREPYEFNITKVIDAAAANAKIIEINANPRRLDMDWRHWRKAADKGVLACINPDAHAVEHFDFVEAGIHVARKGVLQRREIFNTSSLHQVRERLAAMKP
ncbi:MAG: PHP domain-containing protein, partial [Opitutales bacterium]